MAVKSQMFDKFYFVLSLPMLSLALTSDKTNVILYKFDFALKEMPKNAVQINRTLQIKNPNSVNLSNQSLILQIF